MNNWVAVLMLVAGLLFGYIVGFTAGAAFALDKGLNAASVLLDVKLTDKARQMVMSLPEIMLRLSQETKDKLNLTDKAYKEKALDDLNQTLTKLQKNKYGY